MKKFILRVITLITIFIALMIIYEIITDKLISSVGEFKLKSNPKYIVLGHSHPESAYNDKIINNFSNLAQSGESYFYTFQKVKEVLKQNNSIETIFIEFTNNQINENMNDWTWGDKYINNKYPLFSSFIAKDANLLLLNNNYAGFFNSFAISSKKKFFRIIKNDFDYSDEIGGYKYLVRDKTDSIIENSKNLYNPSNILKYNQKISKINILYLHKIINLVNDHGVRIILIRSPLHQRYSGYINEKHYKKILDREFGNLSYLDLSKFPLKNSEFGDLEHLNYKGATKFSSWFNSLIKNGMINNEICQQKTDSLIHEYKLTYKIL